MDPVEGELDCESARPLRLDAALVAELAERSGDAMASIDSTGRIVWLNQAAVGELGGTSSPTDLIGRTVDQIVHPEDMTRLVVNLTGMEGGATPRPGSIRLRKADGTYTSYEVSPSRIDFPAPPAGPGPLVVVVIRDNGLTDAHFNFMADISAGEPFRECAARFAAGLTSSVDGPMAISYDDEDGRRIWVGEVPELLTGVDGGKADRTPGTPWADALERRCAVSVATVDLPEPFRGAALDIGAAACVAVPVPDPGSKHPALMVQWPPSEAMVHLLTEALARKPHDSLAVAVHRRATLRQLERMARHDDLTDLVNRAPFFARMEELEAAGADYAVWYIDLDHLKAINDAHGHQVGDAVLVECARRLVELADPDDVVARLGGDEFAIVGRRSPNGDPADLAAALVSRLADPFRLGDPPVSVSVAGSVGLAVRSDVHGTGPDAVVVAADSALYGAKRSGRRTWRKFSRSG